MMLHLTTQNRPGVLDQITGSIRRKGWNIQSVSIRAVEDGTATIQIMLEGRQISADALGDSLNRMDGVKRWRLGSRSSFFMREYILALVPGDKAADFPQLRVLERQGDHMLCDFSGPLEEGDKLAALLGEAGVAFTRSGVVALEKEE